jgi:hypothetical protein
VALRRRRKNDSKKTGISKHPDQALADAGLNYNTVSRDFDHSIGFPRVPKVIHQTRGKTFGGEPPNRKMPDLSMRGCMSGSNGRVGYSLRWRIQRLRCSNFRYRRSSEHDVREGGQHVGPRMMTRKWGPAIAPPQFNDVTQHHDLNHNSSSTDRRCTPDPSKR